MALFVAMNVANLGNFAFHGLAGRLLGPVGYGALGSLLAVLVAVSVPLGAYQSLLAGEVAQRAERGEGAPIGPLVRRFAGYGALIALAVAVGTPFAAEYLHLPAAPLLLAGLYAVPLLVGVVPWAVLVGTRRFRALGVAILADVAVRLVSGVALMGAGLGVTGAMLASCASETVLVVLLLAFVRWRRAPGRPLGLGARGAALGAVAAGGLWLLVAVDVVLARHLFAADVAGRYAATAAVAKAALFLPQSVTTVFLASFASSDVSHAKAALRRALLASGALGLLATAGLVVLLPSVLPVVFGPSYDVSRPVVGVLGLAVTELGLVGVLMQYRLARREGAVAAAWAGVPLAVVGGGLVAHSPLALAWVMALTAGFVLVVAARPRSRVYPQRPSLGTTPLVDEAALDLTVVVPYYNPGELLRPNLLHLVEALRSSGASFEIVAVSDGSTDGSPATIADVDPDVVRHVCLPANRGKGEALRVGLRHGRGRYLGFIDSDGDLDPDLWQPFLELVRIYRPDAVVGSKRHPLSDVQTSRLRRVYSWGFQLLTRMLFRLPVRDTQVGIKLFRRELLVDVLPYTREQRFAFDLELLALGRRLGYRRLLEAPVTLRFQQSSTIRFRHVVRTLFDTLRVAWTVRAARVRPTVATVSAGLVVVPAPRRPVHLSAVAEAVV